MSPAELNRLIALYWAVITGTWCASCWSSTIKCNVNAIWDFLYSGSIYREFLPFGNGLIINNEWMVSRIGLILENEWMVFRNGLILENEWMVSRNCLILENEWMVFRNGLILENEWMVYRDPL